MNISDTLKTLIGNPLTDVSGKGIIMNISSEMKRSLTVFENTFYIIPYSGNSTGKIRITFGIKIMKGNEPISEIWYLVKNLYKDM